MSPDQRRFRAYQDTDLLHKESWGGLSALEAYFGKPLAEGLAGAGARRVVEVGCGYTFTRMKQLACLTTSSGPLFSPDNLVAIDPGLFPDRELEVVLGTFGDRFRRKRLTAEELRDKITEGESPSFDLVMSRGVVSVGWNVPTPRKEQESIDKVLKIVGAMKDCLGKDNPNALLVMEAQLPDEILLFSRDHLRDIGLDVVYHEMATDQEWTGILRKAGVFPTEPENSGFRLVICKSI